VIISRVGLVRDMPTDFTGAFVVAARDAQALATAMAQCMTNKKARSQAAAQGHQEAQKFAWPTIAQAAEHIYQDTQ
ncbi:MAG TPA: hypothetical protein VFT87_00535, partial [Candidatus Saccharimonadales bacterium]|nr:hypothetical protein [Candidatus Saccharimonadales bacterium]